MADRVTVWVLGDQLNPSISSLAGADPATHRILLVESEAKLTGRRWHVQRLHVVLAGMRRFADELRGRGFEVDLRRAPTFAVGLTAHREEHGAGDVVAMEPAGRSGRRMLE